MKMPTISLLEWQKKFGTEKACIKTLTKVRCFIPIFITGFIASN